MNHIEKYEREDKGRYKTDIMKEKRSREDKSDEKRKYERINKILNCLA